jgi:hypothetical protein
MRYGAASKALVQRDGISADAEDLKKLRRFPPGRLQSSAPELLNGRHILVHQGDMQIPYAH